MPKKASKRKSSVKKGATKKKAKQVKKAAKKPVSKSKKKATPKYPSYMKDAFTKKQYKHVIEEYSALAPTYNDKWESYLASTEKAILDHLNLKGKETILDAGCGTGSLLYALQKKFNHKGQVMGFDITPAMLELAEYNLSKGKFNKNLALELAHCENFSAKNGSVDVVISSSVLHHLPHPDKAVAEFHRVLKKNGRLLIVDFCTDFGVTMLYDSFARLFHKAHNRAFSSREVETLLKKHKFSIKKVKTWKATSFLGVMLIEAKK